METPLTAKERLFCGAYARLLLPREAALEAGYPGKKAAAIAGELLCREEIRQAVGEEIRRAPHKDLLPEIVKNGLLRLIFSSAQGGVTAEGADLPDLFGVSEIKSGKNGVEVKFADRLRALELLWEIAKEETPAGESPIYQALLMSAKALEAHGKD
ncbi:terminase small subunit [Merdimmobilis hominis]|uniref:terminase small subunit n=1 Tax=Merdimmobilis hominis TaxID=2897707 RepID=UPI00139032E3|nr:terminase small subunit [Merdimmobilis hominis]